MIRAAVLTVLLASCVPHTFRADVGAMFVHTHGDVALQNSAGTLGLYAEQNDLHDSLDLGDTEGAPFVRLQADWERHRVKVGLFGFEQEGSSILQRDYGNIPAGTAVTTKLQFFNAVAAWSYDLMQGETLRLAPGVQLGYYGFDVAANSAAPAAFEKVTTDVVVPEAYVEGEVSLGLLSLNGSLGLMSADLGDANGRYLDLELGALLRPRREFEVIFGYRHIVMDAHGRASDRDFDADVFLSGWFIGGGLRF
jgi:hypothetical protein